MMSAASCDLAHLAVEYSIAPVLILAHHQTTDAVVGGVAAAIVILDIVFGVVGIADTCQTVVVVGVGLSSFLPPPCSLSAWSGHCQAPVIGERRDTACRVVDLRAAVAHACKPTW